MNKLKAIIKQIKCSSGITLTDVEADGIQLSALLVDVPSKPEWLTEGNEIFVAFKETEVSIAKNFTGKISMRNQLKCCVDNIQRGVILSIVKLSFNNTHINSAITTRSVDMLELAQGDKVTALIKANEVSLIQK
jgi:molybdate transport system regulatory protein